MSMTAFLNFIAWTLFGSSFILIYLDNRRDAAQNNAALRRPLANLWSQIRGAEVWHLPENLLDLFINGAKAWNNAAVRFFDEIWVALAIGGLVLMVEQVNNGEDPNQSLRWLSTAFTFATFFIFRSNSVGRWFQFDLGMKGRWLFWPITMTLAAGSVAATLLHTMNFVALFNQELTALQALLYAPVLMLLLRWSYMRAIVWPAIRLFDWDVRNRNRLDDELTEYLGIQAYLEENDDEDNEMSDDEAWDRAQWRVRWKHARRAERINGPLLELKSNINIMQSGFLASTLLTVFGLYVGRYFDASSQLDLTPQILIANTFFDALTIAVTIALLRWVSFGGFLQSWTLRLLIAAPLDLALGALFAVASIYLSLVGTEHAITLGQSYDLLLPDIVDNSVYGLGPEFWIMHTTFLPTSFYLIVLLTGVLAYFVFIWLPDGVVSQDPNQNQKPLAALASICGIYGLIVQALAILSSGWRFFG